MKRLSLATIGYGRESEKMRPTKITTTGHAKKGTLLAILIGIAGHFALFAQEDAPVGNPEDGRILNVPASSLKPLHAPAPEERNMQMTAPLRLAANGNACMPIIISHRASKSTKAAAAELAGFLERITGAKFPVQTPDGNTADLNLTPPKTKPAVEQAILDEKARLAAPREKLPPRGILLGTLEEWQAPDLEKPLEIHHIYNGREAFAIRTQAERLLLIAATDRGVSHVVFRWLETLGCRWFFPNSHWEIIPSLPQLTYDRDITDRPTIAARSIFFSDGGFSDEGVSRGQSREPRDLKNWQRHNLLGASLGTSAGHMWQNVVNANLDTLREHPEYFAEVKGARTGMILNKNGKPELDEQGRPKLNQFAKLELAQPAVRKMFADYVRGKFLDNPELDMVSLDPSDGGGHSESEEARRLGSVSDAVFGLANEVAVMVQKEFPGKMIGLLAYNFHIAPPSFNLEPNVYVELTAGFNMSKYSYAELFEMWPQKTKNLGFYEYFSVYDWDQDRLPGGRVASISWLRERLAFYAGMNGVSISAQSGNSWGPHGRGYYLASKLLWDPQADTDALLADFYEKAYGPAAAIMKRYHERISPDANNLISTALLGQAFHDVDEACKVAASRADVLERLNDIKQYLAYLRLRWKLDELTDKDQKREAFVAMMRQLYASRYSYMTHWAAASYRLGKIYGVQLQDITLVPSGGRKHPKFANLKGDLNSPDVWVNTPEIKDDTIEAEFQEGLRDFPLIEVNELPFDLKDLVPVSFPPTAALIRKVASGDANKDDKRTDYYQSGPLYAFYSFAGEPLKLEITTGRLAQYRGRDDATWWLRRPDQTVVETGRMPLDNQPRQLEVKVPEKGTYIFELKSNGSGWTVTYPTTQPATILWKRGTHVGFGYPVFYVPKGTKQIQYFWNGGAHDVFQPDGKLAGRVNQSTGSIASIPVPDGMDGALWCIRTSVRNIWFMNIPNVMAATPEALLIPRGLALKDGLAIRKK